VSDLYRNFQELEEGEQEGRDWAREFLDRQSRILIVAPHGGWIEPLTTEMARRIAGGELSFYSFLGLKEAGSRDLHITSHRFDDPVALEAAEAADRVLAIHGERTRNRPFVMVGGRCNEMRGALSEVLASCGFSVREPRAGLRGSHRHNICNRGRLGAGGQLEVSEGLRTCFRRDPGRQEEFVTAVRSVILPLEETPAAADLHRPDDLRLGGRDDRAGAEE
jgi:phage replication-related protein YjqB (UPF0714/DUF867 family)